MAKEVLRYAWRDVNVAYDLELYTEDEFSQITPERRLGIDRRKFTYTAHIPERRSGKDRRRGVTSEDI